MVNKCDLYKNIQIKVGVIWIDQYHCCYKLKVVCQPYLVTG